MSNRAAVGLAAGAGCLYGLTVFPGPGPTLDSLEFQTAVTVMGVAHPPGSPLYLLLGKLFTLAFPFGDIALRLNLFSAAAAAVAVGLIYLLVERWSEDPGAAAFAALLLAVSRQFWYQAIISEGWALNAAFLGGFLLVWTLWMDTGSLRWYWAALAAYALSLGNHASMALLLYPLVTTVLGLRAELLYRPRYLLLLLGLVLLAALPYGYVPLRAPHATFCNYCPSSSRDLLDYFSGGPFKGALFDVSWVGMTERISVWIGRQGDQFGLIGIGLLGVGVVRALRGPFWRGLFLVGAYLWFTAFPIVYNVPDWPEFFSPAFYLLALLIGLGAAKAKGWIVQRASQIGRGQVARLGLAAAAVALLALKAQASYRQIQSLRDPFLRNWSASFLEVIEPGAWVLMPPGNSPAFLQAWALRYRAWAQPGKDITLVAPPGYLPPGPPPGYLTWEVAADDLREHPLYVITLDDAQIENAVASPARGTGGDLLGYSIEFHNP